MSLCSLSRKSACLPAIVEGTGTSGLTPLREQRDIFGQNDFRDGIAEDAVRREGHVFVFHRQAGGALSEHQAFGFALQHRRDDFSGVAGFAIDQNKELTIPGSRGGFGDKEPRTGITRPGDFEKAVPPEAGNVPKARRQFQNWPVAGGTGDRG